MRRKPKANRGRNVVEVRLPSDADQSNRSLSNESGGKHKLKPAKSKPKAPARKRAKKPAKKASKTEPDIKLQGPEGEQWVRHFCRSCRKVPLWAVLGEPVPMCEACRREQCRLDPMGPKRVDLLDTEVSSHETQYHGERWYLET